MTPNKDIYTFDPIKRRVLAGYMDSDGVTFVKTVQRRKHYFHIVQGYGIQFDVWEVLARDGTEWIRIDETDTGKRFVAHLDIWREHGSNWTGKHGKQRVLSEKYMQELKRVAPPREA